MSDILNNNIEEIVIESKPINKKIYSHNYKIQETNNNIEKIIKNYEQNYKIQEINNNKTINSFVEALYDIYKMNRILNSNDSIFEIIKNTAKKYYCKDFNNFENSLIFMSDDINTLSQYFNENKIYQVISIYDNYIIKTFNIKGTCENIKINVKDIKNFDIIKFLNGNKQKILINYENCVIDCMCNIYDKYSYIHVNKKINNNSDNNSENDLCSDFIDDIDENNGFIKIEIYCNNNVVDKINDIVLKNDIIYNKDFNKYFNYINIKKGVIKQKYPIYINIIKFININDKLIFNSEYDYMCLECDFVYESGMFEYGNSPKQIIFKNELENHRNDLEKIGIIFSNDFYCKKNYDMFIFSDFNKILLEEKDKTLFKTFDILGNLKSIEIISKFNIQKIKYENNKILYTKNTDLKVGEYNIEILCERIEINNLIIKFECYFKNNSLFAVIIKNNKIIFYEQSEANVNFIFINKNTKIKNINNLNQEEISLCQKYFKKFIQNPFITIKIENIFDKYIENIYTNTNIKQLSKNINNEPNELIIIDYSEEIDNENLEKTELLIKLDDKNVIEEIIDISVDNNARIINENDVLIGYKLAVDDNKCFCVVELEIKKSKIIYDFKYDKYRTEKCIVKCIGKLNDNDYFSSKYGLECCICYYNYDSSIINNNYLCQFLPCYHKICYNCLKDYNNKKCPICRIEYTKILNDNTKIAYSCVYGNLKYIVGDEIIVDDFDNDNRKSCGNGVHFHRKIKDVFKWKEYYEEFDFKKYDDDEENNCCGCLKTLWSYFF